MSAISIKQLLEAGVHFGHQTHRWNPRMKEYIFGERNGIYIIDLQQTLKLFKEAVEFLARTSAQGKGVLFVGTKRQAQEAVQEAAASCGMHYVSNRWLGGLLTNFVTIRNSIKRYKELEGLRDEGFYSKLSKKEVARLERERKKLEKNLKGIREMDDLPGALFVVDSGRETIAVKEAAKLGIPVVAIVDTNSDPELVDFVIPGNDDALRSIRLFSTTAAEAVSAGRAVYDANVEAERREAREKAREEAARRAAEREKKEARVAKAKAKAAETAKADAEEAPAEVAAKKAAAAAEKVTVEAQAVAAQPAKVEAKPVEPEKEAGPAETEKVAKPRKAVAKPKSEKVEVAAKAQKEDSAEPETAVDQKDEPVKSES